MKKLLLFVAVFLVAPYSIAAGPYSALANSVNLGTNFSTPQAACAAVVAYWTGHLPSVTFALTQVTAGKCYASENGVGSTVHGTYSPGDEPVVTPQCQSGTLSGFTLNVGTNVLGTQYPTGATPSYPTSDGSCQLSNVAVEGCFSTPNSDGKTQTFYCSFHGTRTGVDTPTGTAPSPSTPPAGSTQTPVTSPPTSVAQGQSCPAGTVSLGIDSTGGTICGGSGTSPATPTQTEVKQPTAMATNPDGSTTTTDVTTRTNKDGSTTTTTTTTTTGTDGTRTTTVAQSTSQKPVSSGGGAGVQDKPQTDFCAQHPELNACKNSSVTGLACAVAADNTACEGDAIQCAILRQQRKEYCENTAANPQQALAQQVIAGNDPLKSTLPSKENAATVNMQSFDQSAFLGGGATCFNDKQVNVMGQVIALPFSEVCDYLLPLRFVMMTIAALVSYRIIAKPVLGD
jgi:hypothetical protein